MTMATDWNVYGEEIIRDFLEAMKQGLIDYMDAEDRNATGKSKSSIQAINVTGSTGQLVGAQYIEYVFKGRAPGRMPPLNQIIDWCNARGIPRGVAWVIAKNIAESGTKLWQSKRNIFDEIITPEKVDAFVDSVAKIYTARLKTEITSLFYTST
jgi:hypothetical protein